MLEPLLLVLLLLLLGVAELAPATACCPRLAVCVSSHCLTAACVLKEAALLPGLPATSISSGQLLPASGTAGGGSSAR